MWKLVLFVHCLCREQCSNSSYSGNCVHGSLELSLVANEAASRCCTELHCSSQSGTSDAALSGWPLCCKMSSCSSMHLRAAACLRAALHVLSSASRLCLPLRGRRACQSALCAVHVNVISLCENTLMLIAASCSIQSAFFKSTLVSSSSFCTSSFSYLQSVR